MTLQFKLFSEAKLTLCLYSKYSPFCWKQIIFFRVAAIAPWFRLRLPSCGPGFKSQAHHLRFFNLYYWNCIEKITKITKINKKRPGLAHFLKKLILICWNIIHLVFTKCVIWVTIRVTNIFQYFAIFSNEHLPKKHNILPKKVQFLAKYKIIQNIPNTFLKCCQSGEFCQLWSHWFQMGIRQKMRFIFKLQGKIRPSQHYSRSGSHAAEIIAAYRRMRDIEFLIPTYGGR